MRFFRNGGAPTYRMLASRPNHPNYSQLGFRVHPQTPLQGGLSCSLLPFAVRHINSHIAQPSTLRWMGVGLWVLAACAGRSMKSMGSHLVCWQGAGGRGQGAGGSGQQGAQGRAGAGAGAGGRGRAGAGPVGCVTVSVCEMGAYPLVACLRQHVVPPQPPQLFSIRV